MGRNIYSDAFGQFVPSSNWSLPSITASGAGGLLTGTAGADMLRDVEGGDTLAGGAGDDTYVILDPRTTIVEAENGGVDTVLAYIDFALPDNIENLQFVGQNMTGLGNPTANLMTTSGSRTTLNGMGGDDVLVDTGTSDSNTFAFSAGSGHDALYGFETSGVNHDFIQLDYGFTTFAQVQQAMTQVGSDVLLQLDASDTILIKNHVIADFQANDFLIKLDTSGLTPSFSEDFNGPLSVYDPSTGQGEWKTNFRHGTQTGYDGWGSRILTNGEQEIYVDSTFNGFSNTALNLNPFSVTNGVLTITAARTPSADVSALNNYGWTSGLISTEKTFTQLYGYFEVRAELPQGQGLLPTIWMLGTSTTHHQEIDILEQPGTDAVYQSLHMDTDSEGGFRTNMPQSHTGFHDYGVLWTPDTITFYIDGLATGSLATPADMNDPMFLMVNLAVGGQWAGAPDPGLQSAQMEIDSIHTYTLDQVASLNLPPTPDSTASTVSTPTLTTTAISTAETSTEPLTSTTSGASPPASPVYAAVTGTSGADTLVGTSADERISGGAGNDVIKASAGNDQVDGGDGSDTLVFAGFAHDYQVAVVNGQGVVSGGPEGGSTTLTSVETLQFLDGTLTFDPTSQAAQIVRLYDAFLGRAPDTAGLNGYLQYMASGHTLADMAANAAASAEFQAHTASLTDAQYVDYVYETSLHRHADAAGLATYVADLANGTFTRTSLILQAAESPEHVALTAAAVQAGLWQPNQTVEALELLYDASVQRAPDASGIAGYSALVASGTTFRQIANQMAGSAEFLAHHAGQTDAEYVDSLYVAEVGRHADAAGLAAYTQQLANGYTRGDILYETAMSQEHQAHVLAHYDPLLLNVA